MLRRARDFVLCRSLQGRTMDGKGTTRSIDTLAEDLIAAAKLTGVGYSEDTIRRVLRTFEDGFSRRSVQIRTTTHPLSRRELCFRYLDLESGRNPFQIAGESGELTPVEHPIFTWLRRVEERFPVLGHGADFEVRRGLAKIWTFIDGAYDPRAFLELPQMPRAFRASLGLLRDLHLDATTIVGVDYAQRSLNLYFRPSHPSHLGPELLGRACARLGFAAPSEAALLHAAAAGCIGFTYGWDAPEIERICFYVAGFLRDEVPAYDPHLRAFASAAPAVVADPRFIVGWSHGRSGQYFKLEDDYTGDVSEVFKAAMGVQRVPFASPGKRASAKLEVPAL